MGKIKAFGEAGVVKRGKGSKLQDRGIPMIFVGYAENHHMIATECGIQQQS
jgi:hypothetical protein